MIRAGRLDDAGEIRVIGLAYSIGEDGDETVEVTVGRPRTTLGDYLTQSDKALDALTRRVGLAGPDTGRGLIAERILEADVLPPSSVLNPQLVMDFTVPVEAGRRYRVNGYADSLPFQVQNTAIQMFIDDGAETSVIYRRGGLTTGVYASASLFGQGAHYYTADVDHDHTFGIWVQGVTVILPGPPTNPELRFVAGHVWLRVEDLGRISP